MERKRKRMIWAWIVGGLVVLVLVPFVVGSLLPERYTAHVVARYDKPPAELWKALTDPRAVPCGGKMARSVELLDDEDGRPVWREDLGSSVTTIRTAESRPSERLVLELSDSVVPMTARWELAIEPDGPDGSGSRITAHNETVVASGTWHVPLFRFILKVLNAAEKGVADYLRRAGQRAGAEVTIG